MNPSSEGGLMGDHRENGMTATHTHSPTCAVCHRPIAAGESYLARRQGGKTTAVHQHLCFPPRARKRDVR
jgi:hypothetical protein